MELITRLLVIIGSMFILGGVGAADYANEINADSSITEMLVPVIIGVIILIISYLGGELTKWEHK